MLQRGWRAASRPAKKSDACDAPKQVSTYSFSYPCLEAIPPAMRSFDKWSDAASAALQLMPDLLSKNQARLELSHADLVVLLNALKSQK